MVDSDIRFLITEGMELSIDGSHNLVILQDISQIIRKQKLMQARTGCQVKNATKKGGFCAGVSSQDVARTSILST